jgi:hypothetical protein
MGHRLTGLLWRIAGPADSCGAAADIAADHDGWSDRDGWFNAACRQAAYSIYQEQELRRVVAACARAGIQPIFLKGTALAYTIYPEAALRPRADHDVLVRADQAHDVQAVLERLGYERELLIPGQLVMPQFLYRRTDDRAIRYLVDVHLKISNALMYGDCLSYEDLRAEAIPMPSLDSQALAPSPVHSLFVACMHRIAHHHDTDDLLWLYDIHLLARSLVESDWENALRLAEARRVCAVVLHGIERAENAVGQSAPSHITERLRELASREPPSPLLASGTRMIDVVRTDFHALSNGRPRLQLIAEHLIPPVSYMRRAYPRWPAALLPLAYAYRIVRGAPKWFRRHPTGN